MMARKLGLQGRDAIFALFFHLGHLLLPNSLARRLLGGVSSILCLELSQHIGLRFPDHDATEIAHGLVQHRDRRFIHLGHQNRVPRIGWQR